MAWFCQPHVARRGVASKTVAIHMALFFEAVAPHFGASASPLVATSTEGRTHAHGVTHDRPRWDGVRPRRGPGAAKAPAGGGRHVWSVAVFIHSSVLCHRHQHRMRHRVIVGIPAALFIVSSPPRLMSQPRFMPRIAPRVTTIAITIAVNPRHPSPILVRHHRSTSHRHDHKHHHHHPRRHLCHPEAP